MFRDRGHVDIVTKPKPELPNQPAINGPTFAGPHEKRPQKDLTTTDLEAQKLQSDDRLTSGRKTVAPCNSMPCVDLANYFMLPKATESAWNLCMLPSKSGALRGAQLCMSTSHQHENETPMSLDLCALPGAGEAAPQVV